MNTKIISAEELESFIRTLLGFAGVRLSYEKLQFVSPNGDIIDIKEVRIPGDRDHLPGDLDLTVAENLARFLNSSAALHLELSVRTINALDNAGAVCVWQVIVLDSLMLKRPYFGKKAEGEVKSALESDLGDYTDLRLRLQKAFEEWALGINLPTDKVEAMIKISENVDLTARAKHFIEQLFK